MRALTIQQPWAWAISHAGKAVENRSWLTSYRGLLAIHAGKRFDVAGGYDERIHDAVEQITGLNLTDRETYLGLSPDRFAMGAVVAVAVLVDAHRAPRCLRDDGYCSPWAVGNPQWPDDQTTHLVLHEVRPLTDPVPCRGWQGLWTPSPDICAAIAAALEPEGTP